MLIDHYKTKDSDEENNNYKHNYSQVFTNNQTDEKIYPLTVAKIADVQMSDPKWKIFFKEDDPKGINRLVIIDETEVLVYTQSILVIPQVLQTRAVQWYHHYLQYPGISILKETLVAVMFWPGIRAHVRRHVKSCKHCQLGK